MLKLLFDANFWYMILFIAAIVGVVYAYIRFKQARVFICSILGLAFVVLTGWCGIELNAYYSAQGGMFGFIGEKLHPNQIEIVDDYTYSVKYLMLTQDTDGGYSATIYANDIVKLEDGKEYGVYVNGIPATQLSQNVDYFQADYRYQFYDDDAITVLCDDVMKINFAFYENSTTIKLSIKGGTNTLDGQSTVNYWNNYFSKNNFVIEIKEMHFLGDVEPGIVEGDTSNFNVVNYYIDGSLYDTRLYQAGQAIEFIEVSIEGKELTDWVFINGDLYAYTYVPFEYDVDGNSLTNYLGNETSVMVPKSYSLFSNKYVTFGEDIAITRIEKDCFNSNVNSVVIQDNITSIAGGAFNKCTTLSNVYLESKALYDILTSQLACGGLLDQVSKVYILADIDDGSNAYLSDTDKFTVSQVEANGKTYNLYNQTSIEIQITDEEFEKYSSDLTPASGGAVIDVLSCNYYESTGNVEMLIHGLNSAGVEILGYRTFTSNASENTFTSIMENITSTPSFIPFASYYVPNGNEIGALSKENLIETYNNSSEILFMNYSNIISGSDYEITAKGVAVIKNDEGKVVDFSYLTTRAVTTESEVEDVQVELAFELYNRAFN